MRTFRFFLHGLRAGPAQRRPVRSCYRWFAEEAKPKDWPKAVQGEGTVKLYPPPEDPSEILRPTENVKATIEALSKLTMLEMFSLNNELAKMMGVPLSVLLSGGSRGADITGAEAPVAGEPGASAAAGAAAGAPAGAAAKDEKKEEKKGPPPKKEIAAANVKLISFPEGAKFNVLREIRKLKPGMNLLDSKKLVENLPQILAKSVPKEELKEWEAGLKAAGAEFEFIE